jgi:aminopeptidase N/puromycin-sensitive aminopeptidase
MAVFREPALEKRALDYAVSGKVRNQDALFTFVIAMQSEETQDFAWQYIQQNWPQVQSQITTTMGGYLVGSTGSFCSADKKEEVTSFFTTHKVPASEKTLKRAQNSIDSCIDLRAEQGAKLQTWLNSQHLEAASASTKGN